MFRRTRSACRAALRSLTPPAAGRVVRDGHAPADAVPAAVENLEDRTLLAAVTTNGGVATVELDVAGEVLTVEAQGGQINFSSTGGVNSGAIAGGLSSLNIIDSAAGTSVVFADSGSSTYFLSTDVTLDDSAAGVRFEGTSDFGANALSVSDVAGGVAVAAGGTLRGTGGLSLTGGAVTNGGTVDTGGGSLTVLAGGTFTNAGTVDTGGGAVTVRANNQDYQTGSTLDAGGGTVNLRVNSGGVTVDLGAADAGGRLGLTAAEQGTFTDVGTLALTASSGVHVSAASNLGGVGTLEVDGGTGVTQAAGATLAVSELVLASNGAVVLDEAGNDFGTVGGTAGGAVTIDDANTLALRSLSAAGNLRIDAAAVTLAEDVTLDSNRFGAGGSLTVTGTVDSDGTARGLTVSSGAAAVNLNGTVGGTSALAALTVNAAGTGAVTLADLGTATAAGVTGAAAVGNAATSALTLTGTNYRTDGSQDYASAGGREILLNAGSDVVFATSNDGVSFGGRTVRLADGSDLSVDAGTGSVSLLGGVRGTSDETVSLNGSVQLGAVGAGDEILSVATSGSVLDLRGDLVTSSTAAGNGVTIDSSFTQLQTGGNDVTIDTSAGGGDVSIRSVQGGGRDLTLDAGTGDVTATGSLGFGGQELHDLSVTAGTLNLGANVRTRARDEAGTDTAGDVTIDAALNVTAAGLTVDTTADGGANVADGTLSVTGPVTTNGRTLSFDVGSTDLALTNASNDFATVHAIANAVALVDVNDLSLGTVTSATTASLTAGGALSVNGDVSAGGNLTLAGNRVDVGPNRTVAATGTGAVNVTASRDVTLRAGSTVTAVDGDVAVTGGTGTPPADTAFTGVTVAGGTVRTTGAGDVAVTGTGAATGAAAGTDRVRGVFLNGGTVAATGTGDVSVTGTSATGGGPFNHGVYLFDGASVAAAAGAVTVTGTARGAGSSGFGVILDAVGSVTSGGGGVTVDGTRTGGSGSFNDGVTLFDGSTVADTADGDVSVTGTAGAGTGDNQGVRVSASTVRAADGDLSVTGTGGAGTNSAGVLVATGGVVEATGAGDLAVNGNVTSAAAAESVLIDGGTVDAGTGDLGLATVTGGAVANAGTVTTDGGTIRLVGGAVDLRAGSTLSAGTAGQAIVSAVAGIDVDLGGADAAGTLGLTADELATLAGTGTLTVRTFDGDITLSAPVEPAGVTTLNLMDLGTSGGSISQADGATLEVATLNLLTSGDVTLGEAGNDFDTLSLTAGGSAAVADADGLAVDGASTGTGLTLNTVSGESTAALLFGTGGLTKTGTGRLTLTGDNTYDGATAVQAGELRVTGAVGHDAAAGTVTVADGATLSGSGTVNAFVSLEDGGTVTATGDGFTLGDGTGAGFSFGGEGGGGATAGFAAADGSTVDANGFAVHLRTGRDVTLGDLALGDGGSVLAASGLSRVRTTVGGTLSGTGRVVEAVAVTGTLSPGNSPGRIETGDLTLADGGTFTAEVEDDNAAGASAGADYDQVAVTGTVSIGDGVTFDLRDLGSEEAAAGDEYVLIANDDTDAIAGRFANLADGGTVTVGGVTFMADYAGGDGNDLTLTGNAPPTVDVGGPYAITEGGGLSLDASGSFDPDDDAPLSYRWDVDGDGDFDENVTGATPTLTAAELAALGIDDDGSRTVRVEATDGIDAVTGTVALTVANAAPADLAVADFAAVLPGETLDLTGSFTDAGSVDTHAATVEWGDGTGGPLDLTRAAGSGTLAGSHTYAEAGTYTVTVTVKDDDGGSVTRTATATVAAAGVRADAVRGGTSLFVTGTDRRDRIHVYRIDGGFGVTINGRRLSGLGDADRVVLEGRGGADHMSISRTRGGGVAGPAVLLGGAGRDLLVGGDGDDVLDGGAGGDRLIGRGGNDVLVGGADTDLLLGGTGRNLLFGGTLDLTARGTSDPAAALHAVGAGWQAAGTAQERIDALRPDLVVGETVFHDATRDVLRAAGEVDWYFALPDADGPSRDRIDDFAGRFLNDGGGVA